MKILALVFAFFLVSCNNHPKENLAAIKSENQGLDSFQDFKVYDYQGLKSLLTTTTNKTYVVNFWATWCAPCVKELPYFERLNSDYSTENVEVILVSLDFPKKYETSLKPFIKKNNLRSKVVALNDTDSNSWIPKISEDWSGAIPATLIFNKDKRQFYEQSFTYDELETEVKQFLK